jgi:DNA-binding MltR family transcriptional regulator
MRHRRQPRTEEEFQALTKAWEILTDREAAIVGGSFLEDRLAVAIKSIFVKLPPKGNTAKQLTEAALFDGYGPLATFNAKIDIGFALGLYDNNRWNDFHIIRSVRNEFAHAFESLTFLDERVSGLCGRIKSQVPYAIDDNDSLLQHHDMALVQKIHYLVICNYLAGYVEAGAEVYSKFPTLRGILAQKS